MKSSKMSKDGGMMSKNPKMKMLKDKLMMKKMMKKKEM
jgi:hypothetical protein